MRLLGGVVRRGGAALLPHLDTLRACIAVGMASEEADVRTETARTLRGALRGMAEIYTTDVRSVTATEWDAGYVVRVLCVCVCRLPVPVSLVCLLYVSCVWAPCRTCMRA